MCLCCTRPDLSYVVGLISRYKERPETSHFLAAKRIMRYVKSTLDSGIWFPSNSEAVGGEVLGKVTLIGVGIGIERIQHAT